MVTPELREYIKEEREAGTDDDAIAEALRSVGWSEEDIAEALDRETVSVQPEENTQELPARRPDQTQKTERPHESAPPANASNEQETESADARLPGTEPIINTSSYSVRENQQARRSSPTAQPSPERKRRSSRVLLSIVIGLVALVLFGASGYAAYQYFSPPEPAEVLARMAQRLGTLKSASYSGTVTFELENFDSFMDAPAGETDLLFENRPSMPPATDGGASESFPSRTPDVPSSLVVEFAGSYDTLDPENTYSHFEFVVRHPEPGPIIGDAEIRQINKTTYLRAGESLAEFAPSEVAADDMWFSMEAKEDLAGINDSAEKVREDWKIESPFALEDLGTEKKSGNELYRYKYTLQTNKVSDFIEDVIALQGTDDLSPEKVYAAALLEDMIKRLDGTLSIDTETFDLREFTLDAGFGLPSELLSFGIRDGTPSSDPENAPSPEILLSLAAQLSEFNEPHPLSTPENVIELKEGFDSLNPYGTSTPPYPL